MRFSNFTIQKYFRFVPVSFFLLISFIGKSQVFPVEGFLSSGPDDKRINFVYLSDGYQESQLDGFVTDAKGINNYLFLQSPFKEYKQFFNAYGIKVPSAESGAKHPATASDEAKDVEGNPLQPEATPNNYFSSTFDYGSIHRLLVPTNSVAISNVLASNFPNYDQAFILVNSPYYGGSGGAYATSSTDASSREVAVHEIGHSFAGLADEYWAGDIFATEKPNMTKTADPATVKWKNWYGLKNIGIYPYGTSGNPATWYRPHQLCKMQYLNYPFCAVCTERFIDRIHQLVDMIDTYSPASTSFSLADQNPTSFSIENVLTEPSTITVNWYLNGSATPFATGVSNIEIPFATFVDGDNSVKVEVVDNTNLSKSYTPGIGYINSLTWTVKKDGSLPIILNSFRGRVDDRKNGILNWDVENVEDASLFTIEKSNDGISFSKVTSVNPVAGKKSYSFSDPALFEGANFYRLVMIGKDGKHLYSNTVRLALAIDKMYYKVYQLSEARRYHLLCRLAQQGKVSAAIYNGAGAQVWKKNFGSVKNVDQDIDLANYPAGVYYIALNINNTQYSTKILAE